eukprot:408930_1
MKMPSGWVDMQRGNLSQLGYLTMQKEIARLTERKNNHLSAANTLLLTCGVSLLVMALKHRVPILNKPLWTIQGTQYSIISACPACTLGSVGGIAYNVYQSYGIESLITEYKQINWK